MEKWAIYNIISTPFDKLYYKQVQWDFQNVIIIHCLLCIIVSFCMYVYVHGICNMNDIVLYYVCIVIIIVTAQNKINRIGFIIIIIIDLLLLAIWDILCR